MITPLYINQTIMYINEEGYLCKEYPVMSTKPGEEFIASHLGIIKYKVNKEGLFEEVKEIKEEPYVGIEQLGLEPRTLNALLNRDILSIGQVRIKTDEELKNIKGMGKRAMQDLKDCLGWYDRRK